MWGEVRVYNPVSVVKERGNLEGVCTSMGVSRRARRLVLEWNGGLGGSRFIAFPASFSAQLTQRMHLIG
jgi:hypothetical protein